MATMRQDAWTEDEDLLLTEVVLRHIREGGTQLSAFKEVGRHLSRTPAACGFRWNSFVRKQYKDRIEEAKRLRKTVTADVKEKEVLFTPTSLTLDDVITFLQKYKEIDRMQEVKELYTLVESLQTETEKLQREKRWLINKLSRYEEEYRTLFDYMDQKRNVVISESTERDVQHLVRDKNTLEKIDK
ncbi:RsfA family transcriptional regulator [Microbacteriaceae bacterium 4G12]